jgi:hypothetical protein
MTGHYKKTIADLVESGGLVEYVTIPAPHHSHFPFYSSFVDFHGRLPTSAEVGDYLNSDSKGMYFQRFGRGLRKPPMIVDYADPSMFRLRPKSVTDSKHYPDGMVIPKERDNVFRAD